MKPVFAIVALTFVVSPLAMGQTKGKNASPNSYRLFDVHLHASTPDFFRKAASANFGAHRKTANSMVTDPVLLLKKTIEYMDKNNIRQGLLSGDNELVQRWVKEFPDRFLASYDIDYSLTDHQQAAKQFEKEVEQGKWRAIGELGLPYAGMALNDPLLFPYYEVCERRGISVFFSHRVRWPRPAAASLSKVQGRIGRPFVATRRGCPLPEAKSGHHAHGLAVP